LESLLIEGVHSSTLASAIHLALGGSVDNLAGGTLSGSVGVVILGPDGTITNAGTIRTVDDGAYSLAIVMGQGVLTNHASGVVIGAVAVGGGPGVIVNAGTIFGAGTVGRGINLVAAGRVTNQAGGTISAYTGIFFSDPSATLVNQGLIEGTGTGASAAGVYLDDGGSLTNQVGGTIRGQAGVIADANLETLTNAGLIAGGTNAGAVLLAGGNVTNAATGTITGGSAGITIAGSASTIVNDGQIGGSVGVAATSGVTLVNNAGGTISGLALTGSGNTVTNAGLLGANPPVTDAVFLQGGSVTNAATGTIIGVSGVQFAFGAGGTVDNAGSIIGTHAYGRAVYSRDGGMVTNRAGGVMQGKAAGVVITNGSGTVFNAGTIGAGSYDSVYLAPGFIHRLIVASGAVFEGRASGGNKLTDSIVSTIEFTSAASQGTITGFGSGTGAQFVNFGQIEINSGADWLMTSGNSLEAQQTLTNLGTLTIFGGTLAGSGQVINDGSVLVTSGRASFGALTGGGIAELGLQGTLEVLGTVATTGTIDFSHDTGRLSLGDPFAFAGLIDGFSPGDIIDLPDTMVATSGTILAGNTLSVSLLGTVTPLLFRLDPTQDFAFQSITVDDDLIGITPPCFRAGTRIMTERGPVAVEDLVPGDRVVTQGPGGEALRPVRWIGHRAVDCARHPDPEKVWPIRVRAHAFARGVPSRDLWLSPDHALYLDGVLVPVKHLVDGEAISRHPVDHVRYYHVELPTHDVLLAEGLPCESYLDSGDRANFDNGGGVIRLHPDFARAVWDAGGCAPLHVTGAVIERTRTMLLARAQRRTRKRA